MLNLSIPLSRIIVLVHSACAMERMCIIIVEVYVDQEGAPA